MKDLFLKSPMAVKLIVPAIMLVGAICVFVYIYFPSQYEKNEYLSAVQRAKLIAESGTSQFLLQLNSKNGVSSQEFADAVGRTGQVEYALITDGDGSITGAFHLKEAETRWE